MTSPKAHIEIHTLCGTIHFHFPPLSPLSLTLNLIYFDGERERRSPPSPTPSFSLSISFILMVREWWWERDRERERARESERELESSFQFPCCGYTLFRLIYHHTLKFSHIWVILGISFGKEYITVHYVNLGTGIYSKYGLRIVGLNCLKQFLYCLYNVDVYMSFLLMYNLLYFTHLWCHELLECPLIYLYVYDICTANLVPLATPGPGAKYSIPQLAHSSCF